MMKCCLLLFALLWSTNASNGSSELHKKSKTQSTGTGYHIDVSGGQDVYQPAVKVSPECWRIATTIVQKTQHQIYASDTSKMCEVLPEAHQKRLALEIARCHLQDLGRPLYRSSAAERECTTTSVDHETVQSCLKRLTDSGENAYTQYITYIQVLCIQLTQEVILQYQQKAKDEVAKKYAEISGQSIAHMETITSQMQTISEIPALLQDQLTRELKDQLKESLDEQLRDRISELLRTQAAEQASFLGNIMDHLELRDVEHQERVNDWTHYQSSMWQKQAREMEGQRVALDEQRLKMERLSETVSETTQNMQPLVGLQSFIKVATEGYTWITFLLHFLGTFNIVWVATRPQRCHPFRSYLYGLVFGEAVLEFFLTSAVHYELLSDTARLACVTDLRRWALLVECFTYVFGFLSTCLRDSAKDSNNDGDRPDFQHAQQQIVEYAQPRQHEQYCALVDHHPDQHRLHRHSSDRAHEGTHVLYETPYDKPGSTRVRHHHDNHKYTPISSSGTPRKLAVFHHQPPKVVAGGEFRPRASAARNDHRQIPTKRSHHHEPMVYPHRYSRSEQEGKAPKKDVATSPLEPPTDLRPTVQNEKVQAASTTTPVIHGKADQSHQDDQSESPRAIKSKRTATTPPDEEPTPKKTALSADCY